MYQAIITIIITVIAGIILGFISIKMESEQEKERLSLKDDYGDMRITERELLQRRGSWRFALDQLLFDNTLRQQISEEADIKVH